MVRPVPLVAGDDQVLRRNEARDPVGERSRSCSWMALRDQLLQLLALTEGIVRDPLDLDNGLLAKIRVEVPGLDDDVGH